MINFIFNQNQLIMHFILVKLGNMSFDLKVLKIDKKISN